MKKTNKQPFNSLLDVVKRFPDEKACREYLAESRWHGKPICPHCGYSEKIYKMRDGALYACAKCRKQFTVKLGTMFEDSALSLQKWFMAIYLIMAHKKGISSVQLGKDIQVTQKTAWFILQRIRNAVRTNESGKSLNGIVEIDETFVGGKTHYFERDKNKKKMIVFGMLQRGGDVRANLVESTHKQVLYPIIKRNVSRDATVMTDEHVS
jgi:transposase-like protein